MKFRKHRFLSAATVVTLALALSSSFVATGVQKVVFEVAVVGKSFSTILTETLSPNASPTIVSTVRPNEQSTLQIDKPALESSVSSDETSKDATPRIGALSGSTVSKVVFWVVYGIWLFAATMW